MVIQKKGEKMKLFEIATEFKALRDLVENDCEFDSETGEVIDNSSSLDELFNGIQLKLSDKLDNSAYVIKELDATSEALKEEAKRLAARSSQLVKNAEHLKSLMSYALSQSGDDKIKTDKFTFSFRKSESVEIDSLITVEDFDRKYVRIKREFDKTKIKTALKNGEIIEGASLSENLNFQIK
jgi:gamma-glutamylcyclotransferase (GGCT)/AIG2-like uncharacterized protein YtfP